MNEPRRAILLAIGGGIAAYKSAMLCSRLAQSGFDVRVAMSHSSTQFIGTATLAALSSHPVATDTIDPNAYPLGAHIELTRDVNLMIVAPATANLIAKFALGIADDLISTLYLQTTSPVLIAPAMSTAMWTKPSVQRNMDQLRADGAHIVGPESGWLSCRDLGEGRMSEPDQILQAATKCIVAKNAD
jgi:phosphopantothenoylcysteine decarboxylase